MDTGDEMLHLFQKMKLETSKSNYQKVPTSKNHQKVTMNKGYQYTVFKGCSLFTVRHIVCACMIEKLNTHDL